MIKAHEIQGILALENSFNRVGLDHVLLVRVATAAVCRRLARRKQRTNHQRHRQRLDRRRQLARLSPYPKHRPAQVLGRRRRHEPRRSAGTHGTAGRNGLPVGFIGKDLGLLRCPVSRKSVQFSPTPGLLCHGKCAVQNFLSGGVSRADGRGVRYQTARRQ